MKTRSPAMSARSSLIAATSLIILALLLIGSSDQNHQTSQQPDRSSSIDIRKHKRYSIPSDPALKITDVMRMGERDWERLLEEENTDLSESDRRDVVELAAELDHSLSTGGATNDPAAEVFAEAILILIGKDEETLARQHATKPGFQPMAPESRSETPRHSDSEDM